MATTFVLAQMITEGDPEVNLQNAQKAVEEAVEHFHPDIMVFPEMFMSHFPKETEIKSCLSTAQSLSGPFVTGMRNLAAKYHIWIVFGMNEAVEDANDDRNYNTTVMLNEKGEIVGTYRKTHLYDAFGFKESDINKPGDSLFEPIDTPFGKIGLFVCYEVRFPEVARYLTAKGADILIMPTAWMRGDLKSHHFRTLTTARAIENTVYVLACDSVGKDNLGESLVVDPMGVVVASGGECPELIPCVVDLERVKAVRKKLPSYKDRRPELYTI